VIAKAKTILRNDSSLADSATKNVLEGYKGWKKRLLPKYMHIHS
jgi:hypothetical protein